MLWHCWLGGRKGIRPVKNMGGWWRWALLSPDGVTPSRMVGVSVSVNLPLHHKVQKFSSGTGSPGWSRKRAVKRLWWLFGFSICVFFCYNLDYFVLVLFIVVVLGIVPWPFYVMLNADPHLFFFNCSMRYWCILLRGNLYTGMCIWRVLLVMRIADSTLHDESYSSSAAKGLSTMPRHWLERTSLKWSYSVSIDAAWSHSRKGQLNKKWK